MADLVWQTDLPGLPAPKRGKVRDIYDLGETLLIVACDRISAYDYVLEPGIPGKGKVLNQLTNFWFDKVASVAPNHLLATDVADFQQALRPHADVLEGRSVEVRKAEVVPFECVARGYLAGSAFKEYQQTGAACGHDMPPGLERASRLAEPIFTPATKAEAGEHDENIDYATLVEGAGADLAATLRDLTLRLYALGYDHAAERGLLLADTKFEFGHIDGTLTLIDEVLTPDSSRYWPADGWRPGVEPMSVDKQYVRNWLTGTGWDKNSTPPTLTPEVVQGTLDRYVEAYRTITGGEPQL